MRRQTSVFGTLIMAIMFFGGGLMGWQHLTQPMLEEASATEEWPMTQGVVTISKLNKTVNSDGQNMYSANVHYNYTVEGKSYSGSNIRTVDGSTSMKSSVKSTLRKYTKDTNVSVYYDPEFPESAVLEPGSGFWMGLLLRLPLLFCAVSILMVVGLFKRLLFGR